MVSVQSLPSVFPLAACKAIEVIGRGAGVRQVLTGLQLPSGVAGFSIPAKVCSEEREASDLFYRSRECLVQGYTVIQPLCYGYLNHKVSTVVDCTEFLQTHSVLETSFVTFGIDFFPIGIQYSYIFLACKSSVLDCAISLWWHTI